MLKFLLKFFFSQFRGEHYEQFLWVRTLITFERSISVTSVSAWLIAVKKLYQLLLNSFRNADSLWNYNGNNHWKAPTLDPKHIWMWYETIVSCCR